MHYVDFRDSIRREWQRHPAGRTWAALRERLALPCDWPGPAWTSDLEREIGLVRVKGKGRALSWRLEGAVAKESRRGG